MPENQQPTTPLYPIPVQEDSAPSRHHSAPLPFPTPPLPGFNRAASPQSSPPSSVRNDQTPQRIPYWLQQSERFLHVIVRLYIGLVVCLVPWFPPFWDSNPLFTYSPWLTSFITQGAVRGVISGIGLLNLWFAIRELIVNAPQSEPR